MSTWRPARSGLAAIGWLFVATGVIAAALNIALRPDHRLAHVVTAIVCVPLFHLLVRRKMTNNFTALSTARALTSGEVAGLSPVSAWRLVAAVCAIGVVEVVVAASIDSGTVIASMTAVVGGACVRNDRLLRQMETARGTMLFFRSSPWSRQRRSGEYAWLADVTASPVLG